MVKFLPSFTRTCRAPLPDTAAAAADDDDGDAVGDELLLRALAGDFMLLPNLRKFKPPPPLAVDGYLTERLVELLLLPVVVSGGMYLRPTMISPRYVVTSSNGSVCAGAVG